MSNQLIQSIKKSSPLQALLNPRAIFHPKAMTGWLMILTLISSLLPNPSFANNSQDDDSTYENETVACEPVCEPVCDPDCGISPCPVSYTLLVDRYLSPVVGANALISLEQGYQALDDTFIPSSYGDKDFLMALGRLTKYALEGVLFSWMSVAQHEYFGHGFRAREFHLDNLHYSIRPYSGYTSFTVASYNRLSPTEKIALHAAGVEGTSILAKTLRSRWLETKFMDQREAHLYLKNALDQTTYVLNTRIWSRRSQRGVIYDDSHDIFGYIRNINLWHGHQVLTSHKLRKMVLIDFLDPYTFYSIFSIGKYIYDGCMGFEYPMIPICDYHYLPGFRLALAPYGPEYQFINYLRGSDNTIQVTLRHGHTGGKHSSGLTVDVYRLFTSELLNFDGSLYLWYQPRFHTLTAQAAKGRLGGGFALTARYRILQCLELIGQLGYKTSGYIPGEVLKHSPIVRGGFMMQF